MVARVALHNMRQDRDEPIRSYGARLRGQASTCKFTVQCQQCNHDVGYTDHILRDVITRNIADSDIQLELLGNENQDMSLAEVIRFVEAKESGKRSATHLVETHAAEAARNSSYKKRKNALSSPNDNQCNYCGKHGHGKQSTSQIRKKSCTAFGHCCKHCGKDNHFELMCRSKDRPRKLQTTTRDSDNAISDMLCTVSSSHDNHSAYSIVLDHHIYDLLSGT